MKRIPEIFALAILSVSLSVVPVLAQDESPEQTQRFQQMQSMMDRAQHAKTPRERQQFMVEHMKLMQEQLKSMHAMMGASMMGQPQSSNLPNSEKSLQMLQQRMDMMQQMMEQMTQMQQMMLAPPSSP